MLDSVIHELQQTMREVERERIGFSLERSEYEARVAHLEALIQAKDRSLQDYARRVSVLEFAIRARDPTWRTAPMTDELDTEYLIERVNLLADRPRVKSCKEVLKRYLSEVLNDPVVEHDAPRTTRIAYSIPCALTSISCLAQSGSFLIAGSEDGIVSVFKQVKDTLESVITLRGHIGAVTALQALPGAPNDFYSTTIASLGLDGTLRIWQLPDLSNYDQFESSGKIPCAVFHAHDDAAWDIAVHGKQLVTVGADGRVCFWGIAGSLATKFASVVVEKEQLIGAAFLEESHGIIVAGCKSGKVVLLDDHNVMKEFTGSGSMTCMFSSSSEGVWFGFSDGSLRRISADLSGWDRTLVHCPGIPVRALSAINGSLVSASDDGTVKFWTGKGFSVEINSESLTCLSVGSDGLLIGCDDGTISKVVFK